MRRFDEGGVVLGAVALGGSVVVFGTLLVNALASPPAVSHHGGAVTVASDGPAAASVEAPVPLGETLPAEILRLAVDRAPFAPDRAPPPVRYRMPGDPVPQAPRPAPELPPAPDFRLLATISSPDGGVAVVQVGDEDPRVVELGDQVMGFRVAAIEGGGAVMSGPGRDVSLMVQEPSPMGLAERESPGDRRMQQAQVIEALERRAVQLQQQIQNQTRGRVEVRGEQVIITGPDGQQRMIQIRQGATPPPRPNPQAGVRMRPGGGGE
jgi:hypothetical protein